MVVMPLITRKETAATLIGSILGVVGAREATGDYPPASWDRRPGTAVTLTSLVSR
jgi:hypothetical protein